MGSKHAKRRIHTHDLRMTVVVRRRILAHRGRLTRKRAEAHVRRRILTYGSGNDTYTCASARAQRHMCAVREQNISR